MEKEKLNKDIETVELNKYIPVSKFRLVRNEDKDITGGISEIRVRFDIKKKFADSLSYKISRSGQVYGWVKVSDELKVENDIHKIIAIELYDWGSVFLISFLYENNNICKEYYVNSKEVKFLIENCLHPNI